MCDFGKIPRRNSITTFIGASSIPVITSNGSFYFRQREQRFSRDGHPSVHLTAPFTDVSVQIIINSFACFRNLSDDSMLVGVRYSRRPRTAIQICEFPGAKNLAPSLVSDGAEAASVQEQADNTTATTQPTNCRLVKKFAAPGRRNWASIANNCPDYSN